MKQETAQLYRRIFDLAWQTAKEAGAALMHERRDLSKLVTASLPSELGPAGWDSLHSGLMAGKRLDYALNSLERMYVREARCLRAEQAGVTAAAVPARLPATEDAGLVRV